MTVVSGRETHDKEPLISIHGSVRDTITAKRSSPKDNTVTHYTPAVHTFLPERNLLPEPRLESRFLAGILSPQPKRDSRPLTRRSPYLSIPSIDAFMHECSYSDDMNAQVGVTDGFDEDGSRLRSPSAENVSPFLMPHRRLNHSHYTHHESTSEYLKISKQYSEDLLKGSKLSQSQAGRRSSLSKRKPSETGLGNEKMSAIDGTRHVSGEIMCIFYTLANLNEACECEDREM